MIQAIVYDPERKVHLMGRGGEMVRFIEENYSCTVDVKEEGVAYVYGHSQENVTEAGQLINVRFGNNKVS